MPLRATQYHLARKILWSMVPSSGHILEVGVEAGQNIPYYPAATTVTGIDIDSVSLALAAHQAKLCSKSLELYQMDVEYLEFADDIFDAVIATFVFCAMDNPLSGLQELSRVVKPDGQIFLLEYVRLDEFYNDLLVDLFDPLIVRVCGIHLNRRITTAVQQAALSVESITGFGRFGRVKLIVAQPDAVSQPLIIDYSLSF